LGLTRFKDRGTGLDGPVSGSIIALPVVFSTGSASKTYNYSWDMPAGMNLELVDINVQAVGVGGDPQLTVGTAKGGTQIVAATTLTTNLGSLTLKETSLTAGGILDIQIVDDAVGDAFDSASVTVAAYVSSPPLSLFNRGDDTGHF
jgi:hypothetical protein